MRIENPGTRAIPRRQRAVALVCLISTAAVLSCGCESAGGSEPAQSPTGDAGLEDSTFDTQEDGAEPGEQDGSSEHDSAPDGDAQQSNPVELRYYRARPSINALAMEEPDLWVGTSWGVMKVDPQGNVLQSFDRFNAPLTSNVVLSLFRDNGSRLWMGTYRDLWVLSNGVWTIFTAQDGFLPGYTDGESGVMEIHQDLLGGLWVAGQFDSGFGRYDGTQWTGFDATDGVPKNVFGGMAFDASGTLWGGTLGDGLYRYAQGVWESVPTGFSGSPMFFDVAVDASDRKWFSSTTGMLLLDNTGWHQLYEDEWYGKLFSHSDGRVFGGRYNQGGQLESVVELTTHTALPAGPTQWDYEQEMVEDSHGALWYGERQSLMRFAEGAWTTLPLAPLVNTPVVGGHVNDLDVDSEGNVWIATDLAVARFDGTSWINYEESEGVPEPPINAIAVRAPDDVWVGGNNSGVAHWDGQAWTQYGLGAGLADTSVHDVALDAKGALWIATNSGVSRLFNGTCTNWTYGQGVSVDFAMHIMVDSDGDVWIARAGPEHPGIARFDGASWQSFTTSDGLLDNFVTDLAQDAQGRMWFCTPAGISIYAQGQWQAASLVGAEPDGAFESISVAPDGAVWLSDHASVFKSDGQQVIKYGSSQGIRPTGITKLSAKSAAKLWFITGTAFDEQGGVGLLQETP